MKPSPPITYTSRHGTLLVLKKSLTKTGKPRYVFVRERKPGEEAATEITAGYEISESPNGLVSLVKIHPKLIPEDDVSIIEKALKAKEVNPLCEAFVKSDSVTIYLADRASNTMRNPVNGVQIKVQVNKQALMKLEYSPLTQDYALLRWSFRGECGWYYLESGDLAGLCKKYFRHIGKESFYELM